MFCYQCQATAKGTGCTLKGVCGKTSEVANLQDLLLFVVRGIAVYNQKLRWEKRPSDEADRFIFDALFITISFRRKLLSRMLPMNVPGTAVKKNLRRKPKRSEYSVHRMKIFVL